MPRRKKCRNLNGPPSCNDFKPKGIPRKYLKTITLSLDEFECIRLADYTNLEHQEAANKLGVSRSVFTRLVQIARQKIAQFLIEGCELVIQGGEYHFMKKVFRCMGCYHVFDIDIDNDDPECCPQCNSPLLTNLNEGFGLKGQCLRHGNK